jgi:CheY-like chemotaxis protein
MNSIVGFSELALDTEIPLKTKEYLLNILNNSEWLLQIINDILDISKIESGKMEIEKVPFDLHELLENCRTMITPKAIEKGIMLHFYAEPSIGKLPLGDPTRLRQVFVNLLSNAVKFTNTGIIKLKATVKNINADNVTMCFEVKDSGIGIDKNHMERIFDPFMQAESGTTRQYGGTGLGLAITKNIVDMLGGELWVESAPGIGSNFSFALTFETIDAAEGEIVKAVSGDLKKPAFEGEVLLCEDNHMNQQVVCEHLARVGLQTVVAENGKIGVNMVRDRIKKGGKQFDLILMDIHMPVMDGIEASAKILELGAGIPIVALTANIMSHDMELYKAHGMNDYVGKPFTSQDLWRCLMKYFEPVTMQAEDTAGRIKSDYELRQKLIKNFVKSNRGMIGDITEAINSGDIKLAHRLTHTLKSNAGQLNKMTLMQAAGDLENCLKSGENNSAPRQIAALEAELNAAIAEFAPLAADTRPSVTAAEERTNAGMAEKKNSILIVDDDPSILLELSHILSPEYKVIVVKDSTAALKNAQEFLPGLILLDVIMPIMSGYEVIAGLKASETTKDIPVIFITGIDIGEGESEGRSLSVDFVRKPFDAEIVKQKVRRQMKNAAEGVSAWEALSEG